MKSTLYFIFLFTCFNSLGQSIVEWSTDFKLGLSDFQSAQTEISNELSTYSITSGVNIDFTFQMNGYEFMFTKNFNSKVKTIFNRKSAVITAPDSITAEKLVNFGQYNFDLTELYSRKFRQDLYNQKGAFSDVNYFKPILDSLQEQMNTENARVLKATNLGTNEVVLEEEHQKILAQIAELSDFCFECKPPKKKKARK